MKFDTDYQRYGCIAAIHTGIVVNQYPLIVSHVAAEHNQRLFAFL